MQVYTDLRLVDTKGAVEALPLPALANGTKKPAPLKAWNRRGERRVGA